MRVPAIILFLLISVRISARTIIVGPGQPVRSLKKAIELAGDNDSILLLKGIYREGSLVLTKSLTITGETGSVLDGENKYETLFRYLSNSINSLVIFFYCYQVGGRW